jgi:hypothetical protein
MAPAHRMTTLSASYGKGNPSRRAMLMKPNRCMGHSIDHHAPLTRSAHGMPNHRIVRQRFGTSAASLTFINARRSGLGEGS